MSVMGSPQALPRDRAVAAAGLPFEHQAPSRKISPRPCTHGATSTKKHTFRAASCIAPSHHYHYYYHNDKAHALVDLMNSVDIVTPLAIRKHSVHLLLTTTDRRRDTSRRLKTTRQQQKHKNGKTRKKKPKKSSQEKYVTCEAAVKE